MFHRRRAHSDDSPKTERAPHSVRIAGRPSNSRPRELLKSNLGSVISTDRSSTRTLGALHAVRSVFNALALLLLLYRLIFAKS